MPHPKGEIKVSYALNKQGKLAAVISIPKGTSGEFLWKGQHHALKGGDTKLDGL